LEEVNEDVKKYAAKRVEELVEKELQEATEARDKAMHDTIVNSEEMEAKIKECNQIISQMKSYDNRHGKVNDASKKIVKMAQDYEEKVATMEVKIRELVSSFDAMKDKMDGMSKQMEDELGATGDLSMNRQTLSNLYDAMVVIEGKIDKFNNHTYPDVNQIEAKCKQIHTNIQKYMSHLGSAAKHDKLSQDIYNKMQVEMKKMDELVQRNTLGHTMDGNSRAQDRAERDDVKSKIKAVQLMMEEMGPIAARMETVLANSKRFEELEAEVKTLKHLANEGTKQATPTFVLKSNGKGTKKGQQQQMTKDELEQLIKKNTQSIDPKDITRIIEKVSNHEGQRFESCVESSMKKMVEMGESYHKVYETAIRGLENIQEETKGYLDQAKVQAKELLISNHFLKRMASQPHHLKTLKSHMEQWLFASLALEWINIWRWDVHWEKH
jgi:hypothetical protein